MPSSRQVENRRAAAPFWACPRFTLRAALTGESAYDGGMTRPGTLALVLTLVLAGPARAALPEIQLEWDKDLAFEWDRANYEKTVREYLEAARGEASSWLGLPSTRAVSVRILTPARYEAQFGRAAAATRGAHYQAGAIFVNGGARLTGAYAGLLAHEMAHALLDHRGTGGRLPVWLNEGIAERIEAGRRGFDRLDGVQVNRLEHAVDVKTLLPLPRTGPLTEFGYLQSLGAVLFLEAKLGHDKLTAVVRRALERDGFERALEAEAGWTMRNVEEEFVRWVDRLQ